MSLKYEKEAHIAKVGLNRPRELNALDPGILLELHRAWEDINADPDIRVAVLYSALPDIFCSGMDLKTAIPVLSQAREPGNEAERWLVEDLNALGEAMLKVGFVEKPVIAAVNGYCLTGGFEMIMGADLRVASEDAVFQMREASLGIMPSGGGNVLLPLLMPPCRALEVLLTAGEFSAYTLYEWGFLNRVIPRDQLFDTAMQLAERIAGNGPLSIQGMIRYAREERKRILAEAFDLELQIGLQVFASDDVKEGLSAQREHRKPSFPVK